MSFKEFEKAVEEIAAEKKISLDAVQQQIVASGGPKRTGTTQTSRVRLHDDKATYTGRDSASLHSSPCPIQLSGLLVPSH